MRAGFLPLATAIALTAGRALALARAGVAIRVAVGIAPITRAPRPSVVARPISSLLESSIPSSFRTTLPGSLASSIGWMTVTAARPPRK